MTLMLCHPCSSLLNVEKKQWRNSVASMCASKQHASAVETCYGSCSCHTHTHIDSGLWIPLLPAQRHIISDSSHFHLCTLPTGRWETPQMSRYVQTQSVGIVTTTFDATFRMLSCLMTSVTVFPSIGFTSIIRVVSDECCSNCTITSWEAKMEPLNSFNNKISNPS